MLDVAFSPDRDSVAITSEFRGDIEVGGVVGSTGSQDQAASEDQGLGSGASAEKSFQAMAFGIGQDDLLRDRCRHRNHPWRRRGMNLGNQSA
jgi:hypothetical protein